MTQNMIVDDRAPELDFNTLHEGLAPYNTFV